MDLYVQNGSCDLNWCLIYKIVGIKCELNFVYNLLWSVKKKNFEFDYYLNDILRKVTIRASE